MAEYATSATRSSPSPHPVTDIAEWTVVSSAIVTYAESARSALTTSMRLQVTESGSTAMTKTTLHDYANSAIETTQVKLVFDLFVLAQDIHEDLDTRHRAPYVKDLVVPTTAENVEMPCALKIQLVAL